MFAAQGASMVPALLLCLVLASPAGTSAGSESDHQFVQNMYRAILCREGDASGIQEKVEALQSGALTRAELIMLTRFSQEYQSTSTYLGDGKATGNSKDECGACSACDAQSTTECCPGVVKPPDGYDESKPAAELKPFFKYAIDESCADCVVGSCTAWKQMAPGTGPQSCTDKSDLKCCAPEGSWGAWVLVGTAVAAILYVGGGFLVGQHHGRRGGLFEAHPHGAQWKVLTGLVVDGTRFSANLFTNREDRKSYTPVPPVASPRAGATVQGLDPITQAALDKTRKDWQKARRPARTSSSRSTLVEAAMVGNDKKLAKLLKTFDIGAESNGKKTKQEFINLADRRGFTAYHHAAGCGHLDCVKELVKAGADTALLNDRGETGWELAIKSSQKNVTTCLEKASAKGKHKMLSLEGKSHKLESVALKAEADVSLADFQEVEVPQSTN